MPCMCGDTYCPSCGPAQGNNQCPVCGTWSADGDCPDPKRCAEGMARLQVTEMKMERDLYVDEIVVAKDRIENMKRKMARATDARGRAIAKNTIKRLEKQIAEYEEAITELNAEITGKEKANEPQETGVTQPDV